MIVKKARGKRPVYFENPQIDQLLAIVMALAGEVSVLRERLDTVERLAEAKGLFNLREIEAYCPSDLVTEERDQQRSAYLARILRVVLEEADLGVQAEAAKADQ
ncbi:MAG TPA: hypothetical protein V6D03_12995 [Candidatus Caenarcaniphilales bacterium]